MGLLNFLFGKKAEIFNSQGKVLHKHPEKKWDAWKKRYTSDPQFNWKNHTGTRAGVKKEKALF